MQFGSVDSLLLKYGCLLSSLTEELQKAQLESQLNMDWDNDYKKGQQTVPVSRLVSEASFKF